MTPSEGSGAKRLKAWREAAGHTQVEAGKLLGVSQVTISDWEAERKQPRVSAALRIARVTDGAVPIESWEIRVEDSPDAA